MLGITVGALGWWERWISRGGAESTAFKTRVPENKGPDAGNYSAASREYHRLRNMLGITLGTQGCWERSSYRVTKLERICEIDSYIK